MNDIHGRGAAGRYDASAVVDVGGAAGPREGADPTSGNDASGDASGARMGGGYQRDAERVVTSDAQAERFEPLEALRRIAEWCAKRGTSHESCDEALDSIYAIACTSRSIADRSTDYRTKQRTDDDPTKGKQK